MKHLVPAGINILTHFADGNFYAVICFLFKTNLIFREESTILKDLPTPICYERVTVTE